MTILTYFLLKTGKKYRTFAWTDWAGFEEKGGWRGQVWSGPRNTEQDMGSKARIVHQLTKSHSEGDFLLKMTKIPILCFAWGSIVYGTFPLIAISTNTATDSEVTSLVSLWYLSVITMWSRKAHFYLLWITNNHPIVWKISNLEPRQSGIEMTRGTKCCLFIFFFWHSNIMNNNTPLQQPPIL